MGVFQQPAPVVSQKFIAGIKIATSSRPQGTPRNDKTLFFSYESYFRDRTLEKFLLKGQCVHT